MTQNQVQPTISFFLLICPVPSQENCQCYIIVRFCVCYILMLCFCCVLVVPFIFDMFPSVLVFFFFSQSIDKFQTTVYYCSLYL